MDFLLQVKKQLGLAFGSPQLQVAMNLNDERVAITKKYWQGIC
jgi:hypothetical protein